MAFRFPEERYELIKTRLAETGRVIATDLARELGVTEDTVRRDLREMAKLGLCQRTYGGALAISSEVGSYAQRQEIAPAGKDAVAQVAAGLVRPGQLVFLDSGTTNLAIVQALPEGQGITVATNSPSTASALIERKGLSIILIGGIVDPYAAATLGSRALRDLKDLRIDLCFLGICAISVKEGLRSYHFEDAEFKRALVRHSQVLAAPVITEKLGTTAPYHFADLRDLDHLIVEQDADVSPVQIAELAGLQVHRASN